MPDRRTVCFVDNPGRSRYTIKSIKEGVLTVFVQGKRILPGCGHAEGRKLLEQMYQQQVGGPMPQIAVTDRGKPYFTEGPWHFSISHSKCHVFCALSQKSVGIDAEEMDRSINLHLADKILSPAERQQYEKAEDQRLALLTFWVLKEAQAKCTGEGLRGYPCQTEFKLLDPRVRQLDGCLVAVIEEDDHVI